MRIGSVKPVLLRQVCAVLTASLLALAGLGAAVEPARAQGPVWRLDIHHNQTNFPPGGTAEYWFDVENAGGEPSEGLTTLTLDLPDGVSRAEVRSFSAFSGIVAWDCPGSEGDSVIVCKTTDPVPRRTVDRSLIVRVSIDSAVSGGLFLRATVEGGGAGSASAGERSVVDEEPASFGIWADSFEPDYLRADALTEERAAGAHPGFFEVPLDFNSVDSPNRENPLRKVPAGNLRNFRIDLPPGFLGSPAAVGECTPAQLASNACPVSSQVGRVDAHAVAIGVSPYPYEIKTRPLFNMSNPRGALADLAFDYAGTPVHIKAELDAGRGYAIAMRALNVNEIAPVLDLRVTLWGVPAAAVHDSERCPGFSGDTSSECSTGTSARPFLTLPSECGPPQVVAVRDYDSWQEPGRPGPPVSYEIPGAITGCGDPRFEPKIAVQGSERRAGVPTGVDARVEVPQSEDPSASGTPPVRDVVLRMPEGLTISAPVAQGLGACRPDQIRLGTGDPVACPASSQIGTASIVTPLLTEPLQGQIFIASPEDNPFQALLALYLVIRDSEDRGLLLKVPGRLQLDPESGRVMAKFTDLPQVPFASLTLRFRDGPRAPLVNSPSCSGQTVTAQISSYALPDEPLAVVGDYPLDEGQDGARCPASARDLPFQPSLEAGSIGVRAGAYTPFTMRLRREDRDQILGRVRLNLPPGLGLRLRGMPRCSDDAIDAISGARGSGRAEIERAACPDASQVGTAIATAGAGGQPIVVLGRVYLAGPYRGAPVSLETALPVVVGPFDLGTVAVRTAIYLNPRSARVKAVTEDLPRILHGIPLNLRSFRLTLDRPGFVRNPTSCEEMAVGATVRSGGGQTAEVADRFQVGGCDKLGFEPRISLRSEGPTGRGAHPALRAVLTSRARDANLHRLSLLLPRTELLDYRNIEKVCSARQFELRRCPAGAAVGRLAVWTLLLDQPLRGEVYLREGKRRLPDLAAALDGQVELDVIGQVHSHRGRMSTVFAGLPDLPLRKMVFELEGGRAGLFAQTGGGCARERRVQAVFFAHSGKLRRASPKVHRDCPRAHHENADVPRRRP